jgi:16S rRNA (guanine966-N2)-methyltransferase
MIGPASDREGYAVAANAGKDGRRGGRREKPAAAAQEKAAHAPGSVRIIGGAWRGRRIRFPALPGLRPSPDRVRETLFNWLAPVIGGARGLDLFAGSGALGLEALSRGAATLLFVDHEPTAVAALRATLAVLEAPPAAAATTRSAGESRGRVLRADAFALLAGPAEPYDLVFLDPPYAEGRLPELCRLLVANGWLAPQAFVYLETAVRAAEPQLPPPLQVHRQLRAGAVNAILARCAEAT